MKTLIARLADTTQYNSTDSTILWNDSTQTRWNRVYSQLKPGDYAIFLAREKILIGEIEGIAQYGSIKLKQVQQFDISNDNFLRLNEVSPENISTAKANFHPFVTSDEVDIPALIKDLNNKRYISFYITKESNSDVLRPLLRENDRIVSVNYNGKLGFLHEFRNNQLTTLSDFKSDLFGAKDKTLPELRKLHQDSDKSNNLAALDRIESALTESGYYKFRTFSEYYNIIHNKRLYRNEIDENEIDDEENSVNLDIPLNQILYGPPGTGKTYLAINKALEILQENTEGFSRKDLTNLFRAKIKEGQIVFTTFHQSMSYEDFIEGIKPLEPAADDTYLKYEVKPGIFKCLCDLAAYVPTVEEKGFVLSDDEFNKASFYKISLGNTQLEEDDSIYSYCIKNNCIALGWGGYHDFKGKTIAEIRAMARQELRNISEVGFIVGFTHRLKKGDYVVVSYGNHKFRAIAKVIGDYEFKNDHDLDYYQFRNVEWLVKDIEVPVNELYNKQFSQQAFYQLDKANIKKEYFVKKTQLNSQLIGRRRYVLVIDEINRGNISQIFGELITLIEENKRVGNIEALEITLPYSKTSFSVPQNLYIIGTMNTADRSVEALDTALRRRFVFEEIMPDPGIIAVEGKLKSTNGKLGDIDLVQLLTVINQRIEILLNRDHLIGHSYFLKVIDKESLKEMFYKNIIPLLQEYFYGDYGKIGLILGNGFVKEKFSEKQKVAFAKFKYEDHDALQKIVYELTPAHNLNIEEAIVLLLNKSIVK